MRIENFEIILKLINYSNLKLNYIYICLFKKKKKNAIIKFVTSISYMGSKINFIFFRKFKF